MLRYRQPQCDQVLVEQGRHSKGSLFAYFYSLKASSKFVWVVYYLNNRKLLFACLYVFRATTSATFPCTILLYLYIWDFLGYISLYVLSITWPYALVLFIYLYILSCFTWSYFCHLAVLFIVQVLIDPYVSNVNSCQTWSNSSARASRVSYPGLVIVNILQSPGYHDRLSYG